MAQVKPIGYAISLWSKAHLGKPMSQALYAYTVFGVDSPESAVEVLRQAGVAGAGSPYFDWSSATVEPESTLMRWIRKIKG